LALAEYNAEAKTTKRDKKMVLRASIVVVWWRKTLQWLRLEIAMEEIVEEGGFIGEMEGQR